VYGGVHLRARMAIKMLKLRGISGVPVMIGAKLPLLRLRPVYWAGHEGKGLLEPEDESIQPAQEHAVDYLVRMIMDNPDQIHLVAIGPLTNVATAFLREPRLARNLAHLTIMGGVVRGAYRLDLPYCEHNIVCDPEAAHIVFSAGAPLTLVPLDVTTLVRLFPAGVERIKQAGTPYHQALAQQVELYPPFAEKGFTHTHDPLAVAAVIRPDLVEMRSLHVDVETNGRLTTGATLARTATEDSPANAQVALEVNIAAFEDFLVQRLAS
jgi:purine nucleosidase